MQMTHHGNGPIIYASKEDSGSHGGTRHYHDQDIHYYTEGQIFGGGTSMGPTHSTVTPKPYMSTFLDGQPLYNHFNEIEGNFEEYAREYEALNAGFRRQFTLDQYCGIKFRGKPKNCHRNNNELEHRVGKMEISYFDGSSKVTP